MVLSSRTYVLERRVESLTQSPNTGAVTCYNYSIAASYTGG